MKNPSKRNIKTGQLAFVDAKHAKEVMPAGWRFNVNEPATRDSVISRFETFREEIGLIDRHNLLSLTGLYTLFGAAGSLQRKGAYTEVAELEFLQAIILSKAEGARCPILRPDNVTEFWKELMSQCQVASLGEVDDDRAPIEVLAKMHTAYYRNPYGDEFFDRMTLSITAEYDRRFARDGSVSGVGIALVALRQAIWERFSKHMELSGIALKGSRSKVLNILRRATTDGMSDDEFKSEYLNLPIKSLRVVTFQALEDAAVEAMFVLDPSWVAEQDAAGLPMSKTLKQLSLEYIGGIDPARLCTANPVWAAPIIRSGENYLLYSPLTISSFPFQCLMTLIGNDEESKKRVEKIRGWFVEQESKRVFMDAFPSAQIVLGGYWQRNDSERIETDLLVLVANRLIIMEAKGALIPDRVRRAAPQATGQFLKKIWGKATRQGAALESHLLEADSPVQIRDEKGQVIMTIDPTVVRSISRFGISIEQMGPLMNAPDMLREVGVLKETLVAAPCILLSEMANVLRHASNELEKLHYLIRRSDVAAKYQIVGDELDIYTTYIQFGFSDFPPSDNVLMLLGASYTIGDYRNEKGIVTIPSDSSLRCSPYFQRVLNHAKTRSSVSYLELGLMLMDMPLEQQTVLEQQIREAFATKPKNDDWPIIMASIETPGEKSAIFIVLIRPDVDVADRRVVALDVLGATAEQLKAKQAVCIVRLWKDSNPYDALYIGGQSLSARSKIVH